MKLEGFLSANETSLNKSKTGKEKMNKAQDILANHKINALVIRKVIKEPIK